MKNFTMGGLSLLLLLLFSCSEPVRRPDVKIIPQPVTLNNKEGVFMLKTGTKILINSENAEMLKIASILGDHLSGFYGIKTRVAFSGSQEKEAVFIKLNTGLMLSKDAYQLNINPKGIELEASTASGLFYGVQSLIQLMPPGKLDLSKVAIPCLEIKDSPRFAWRGLHLDVGRHFMPKEFILRYLDYMAMHKLNTFHWHLTEDQGWRIEIKKYPRLTEVGSIRKETIAGHLSTSKSYDGIPVSGFYTQEDIKEVVNYAAERFITVVPEIEMPGHALAALASYPEYGCTGGPYEVATTFGVFKDVFCAGKDTTFKFIEDVLAEVIPLFPGEYIHVGGDECPKASWEICPDCQARIKTEKLQDEHQLQSYFIQRIEKYLNANGKKLIGWDEILEGGLAPNAAVMSWRGESGGVAAARQQHYVVMSPGSHCYFDFYQADPKNEPLAIGGFLPLEKVYSYEPIPAELTPAESNYVLGAQGNVWTEYMKTPKQVEYMAFPRAAALSEVLWSPKASRDFDNFKDRLNNLVKFYDAIGMNYCKTGLNPASQPQQ